jgi:PAS domain S-box-containing protein
VQASLIGEAIDHGPVAVFVADDEMRYVAVNAFACELLGYERDELLSLTVADVVAGPDTQRVYGEFVAAGSDVGRIPLRRRDGGTVELEYRAEATTVAGLTLYVSVGWPVSEAPAPRRRSARARG